MNCFQNGFLPQTSNIKSHLAFIEELALLFWSRDKLTPQWRGLAVPRGGRLAHLHGAAEAIFLLSSGTYVRSGVANGCCAAAAALNVLCATRFACVQ
jgi:hypothetical protein